MSKSRLEAFSDGVIAIIITIMVLGLTQPAGAHFDTLIEQLPMFIGYAISYFYLGIYWVNHHRMLVRVDDASNRALWINLAWLFCISLIPFATGWSVSAHFSGDSTLFYSVLLLVVALVYQALHVSVLSDCAIIPAVVHNITHNKLAAFSIWVLLAACLLSYIAPIATYVLIVITVTPWIFTTQEL